jgi:hypothetical protein
VANRKSPSVKGNFVLSCFHPKPLKGLYILAIMSISDKVSRRKSGQPEVPFRGFRGDYLFILLKKAG